MTGHHYAKAIKEFYALCARTPTFMRNAGKCRVLTVNEGHVVVEFDVAKENTNVFGTLHGGFTSSLIDTVTSSALLATPRANPGFSVDLHITYLNTAKIGDTCVVDARVRSLLSQEDQVIEVVKWGKRLAFTSAEMRRKQDGQIIATGVHTKAIPSEKFVLPVE